MNSFTTLKPSGPIRVPYTRRDPSLNLKGALFISHNGDQRLLPDGWLSLAELTAQGRLLTLHYSVGKVRVRGCKLDTVFQDACRGCLGELRECGSPAPAQGLWISGFEWQFPVEESEELAEFILDHPHERSSLSAKLEQETLGRRPIGTGG